MPYAIQLNSYVVTVKSRLIALGFTEEDKSFEAIGKLPSSTDDKGVSLFDLEVNSSAVWFERLKTYQDNHLKELQEEHRSLAVDEGKLNAAISVIKSAAAQNKAARPQLDAVRDALNSHFSAASELWQARHPQDPGPIGDKLVSALNEAHAWFDPTKAEANDPRLKWSDAQFDAKIQELASGLRYTAKDVIANAMASALAVSEKSKFAEDALEAAKGDVIRRRDELYAYDPLLASRFFSAGKYGSMTIKQAIAAYLNEVSRKSKKWNYRDWDKNGKAWWQKPGKLLLHFHELRREDLVKFEKMVRCVVLGECGSGAPGGSGSPGDQSKKADEDASDTASQNGSKNSPGPRKPDSPVDTKPPAEPSDPSPPVVGQPAPGYRRDGKFGDYRYRVGTDPDANGLIIQLWQNVSGDASGAWRKHWKKAANPTKCDYWQLELPGTLSSVVTQEAMLKEFFNLPASIEISIESVHMEDSDHGGVHLKMAGNPGWGDGRLVKWSDPKTILDESGDPYRKDGLKVNNWIKDLPVVKDGWQYFMARDPSNKNEFVVVVWDPRRPNDTYRFTLDPDSQDVVTLLDDLDLAGTGKELSVAQHGDKVSLTLRIMPPGAETARIVTWNPIAIGERQRGVVSGGN